VVFSEELVGELAREPLRFSCELLLRQNAEEEERPPLKAASEQRLVNTVTDSEDLVCAIVIREV
jgi:hypothetical protein